MRLRLCRLLLLTIPLGACPPLMSLLTNALSSRPFLPVRSVVDAASPPSTALNQTADSILGAAANVTLCGPTGLSAIHDASGVFISDQSCGRILFFSFRTGNVSVVAGPGELMRPQKTLC